MNKVSHRLELSVILPIYNEESIVSKNLLQVFNFFSQVVDSFEIIAVIDGSTDDTLHQVQAVQDEIPNLRILQTSHNIGKGDAVRRGVLNSFGEWVLFTDVDLSTPLDEYRKLIKYISDYDIVIGSRGLKESQIVVFQPRFKILLGKAGNLLVRVFLGLPFKDTQCGFKMFRRTAAVSLFQKQLLKQWGFDFEILYLAQKDKILVKEVPVQWADSSQSLVKGYDYLKTLRDVFVVRLNDLRGLYK